MSEYMISIRGLTKDFVAGDRILHVLRGLDLDVARGEALCILGASGSGKSTLLHVMSGLDKPTAGEVYINGKNVVDFSDQEMADFRSNEMGFVFQSHYLLSELTVQENVALPLKLSGRSESEANQVAAELLEMVGLQDRIESYPQHLSGGEMQRAAIARALSRKPKVLFADEPTGNLDSQNALAIQSLFFTLHQQMNLSLVVITHDLNFAKKFKRIMTLKDGAWVHLG